MNKFCKLCKHYVKNNGCACLKECRGTQFEPKQPEETMTEKIQGTKEQLKQLFVDIGIEESMDLVLREADKHGYIIKPEIEQKIEEAENKFFEIKHWAMSDEYRDVLKSLFDIIQLLKPYYYKSKEK